MKHIKNSKLKRRSLKTFFASLLVLSFIGMPVLAAYPALPTVDNTWGFTIYESLQVPTRYWQYGDMNWSSAISYAQSQYSANPARISINVSDSNSYNSTKIRVSSNYWTDVTWAGLTTKVVALSNIYEVSLNSAKSVCNDSTVRNYVATHEILHAFGLNDCSTNGYIMYGYTDCNRTTISDYETNLLLNRYGRY